MVALKPGAERIRLTKTEPGKECQYIGEVTGSQSGTFTTSNVSTDLGARNDLKNKALALGGDTVVIITDNVSSDKDGDIASIILAGNVYKCSN